MGKEGFDWTLARSFLAVLDAGSLSAAAQRLHLQQPTLSRHVAAFEAKLGTPLFERSGRGMVPTAAAQAIAAAARRMEQGAAALQQQLRRRREATRGTVRITTSEVAASWLPPPVLASLREAEPGIQSELVASNQITNLLRREADIAVRMVRPAQASLVAREQFVLRTDDQRAYVALVAAGDGIGFVARYTLRLFSGVLFVLPQLKIAPLPCWLAVHREIRGSPLVRRVYDFLAEAVPRAAAA